MENTNFCVSSTSIDENTGSARILIDGQMTVPNECDDPIVELFRPVRMKYKEEMFFIVTVKHKEDSIVCTLFPSNTRNRPLDEFLATSISVLEGDINSQGMILDYIKILETYFNDKDGLDAYLKRLKTAETADEEKRMSLYVSCNTLIKEFVTKIGLTMPSRKKVVKPQKTKAQKRADSKAYQNAHPEVKKSNNQ